MPQMQEIREVVNNQEILKWKLPLNFSVTSMQPDPVDLTKTLLTAGTLIDRNIIVEPTINVRSASEFGLNITNVSGSDSLTAGTKASGYYPMTANNLMIRGTFTASTPGWFNSGTADDTDVDNASVGKVIAAAATVSGTATATSPTIARTSTSATGATNIGSASVTTTAPSSGYFVSVQATAPATTISLTKTVNTAGYLGSNSEITASASTSAKTGSVYYLPVTTGVAAGDAASVSKYTTDGSNAGVSVMSVVGNATTTEPTSGYYVAFTGKGNSKVTTAGWFPTGSLASKTSSATYFPVTAGTTTVAGGGLSVASNYSGTPTVNISLDSQSTSGIAITDTAQSSGYYIKLTGSSSSLSGTTEVGRAAITLAKTAGYIPAQNATTVSGLGQTSAKPTVTVNAGSKTRYLTIPTASFSTSANGVYCSGAGWVPAGSASSPIGVIGTTSVTQGTSTIPSGATAATRGIAQWGTGYITSGSIPAATFANSASSGVTYLDISNVSDAPMLISGDYLYINKGYTDNLKISLAKLVPDWNTTDYPNIAGAAQMLQGYVAYNQDGGILTGTIPSFAPASKYYATTSDQSIATKDKYLTGNITISKLTSSNYSAANIKHNVTITVNNGNANVYSVKGTFTSASTVSSGQTAAAAGQILSGYSAWVNGAEVKGSVANGSGITFNGKTATAGAGYYATAPTADMQLAAVTSPNSTISSVTYTYNSSSGKFDIAGSNTIAAPTVSRAGYISSTEGSKTAGTANVSTTVNKVGLSASISGTAKVTPTLSKVAEVSGNDAINIGDDSVSDLSAATTTKPTSGYYVAIKSNASSTDITATPAVSSAGYGTTSQYSATTATQAVGANDSVTTYFTIPGATATVTGTNTVTPSASVAAGNSNVTLSTTNNGIPVTATGGGTASVTATAKTNVSGYAADSATLGSATLNASSKTTTATKYITAITVPKDKTFTLTTTADTALDSTSNVTINNNAYRQLVVSNAANGDVNVTNTGRTDVVSASSSNGTVTVSAYPKGTGTTIVAAKTIVSGGRWAGDSGVKKASVTSQTGPFYGEIYVAPMSDGPDAVGSISFSPTTGTQTPAITKQSTPSGVTNAANGNATTTAPSSGVYVAVKSDAKTTTLTATETISTAGYAAAGTFNTKTLTIGAAASAMTYVPIKTATPAFDGGAVSGSVTNITGTNVTLSDTNNGIAVTGAGTATRAAVLYNGAVSGWVTAADNATALAAQSTATTLTAKTRYITGVNIPVPSGDTPNTFNVTVPNGASDVITFVFKVDKNRNVWVEGL